ncbi:MAG: hypothetical protein WB392_00040 [Methanotrichaceae archaeon]
MKKLAAIVSIVLLFAGIGLTLGQSCGGNCNCPSGTACSQSVCGANCVGSCTHDASVSSTTDTEDASSASSASAASQCGTNCPKGGCAGQSGCKGCCGNNCAGCCACNNGAGCCA